MHVANMTIVDGRPVFEVYNPEHSAAAGAGGVVYGP